jgi:hypothetical protein
MSVLGIYLGPKIIYLVETEGRMFKNSIQISQKKISGMGTEEKVPEEIKIATIFKDELVKNNINVKEANIVLLGKDLIIRTFYMPVMPQSELNNAVRFEAKKYIPFKLEELVSDFQLRFDKASRKNFVLFVGIKKEILDKYLQLLSQLKIKPSFVEYSGFSILRLLKLANVKERGIYAIVNIDLAEEDEVNFIVLEKRLPLFSRDIVLSAELPLSSGGTAKIDFAAILEKLKVELRISLDFYLRKFPTKNIKSVIFIAPEDLRMDLEAFIKERGLSVKFADLKKLIDKPVLFSSGFFKAYAGSLVKLVGNDLKINLLLSKDKIRAPKIAGFLEGGLLTFLTSLKINFKIVFVGLLIVASPYILDFYLRKPIHTKLKEVISSQPKIDWIEPNKSYDELNSINSDLREKRKTITNLVSKRLFVSEQLDIFPRIIPAGIWFREVSFTKTQEGVFLTLHCSVYLGDSDKELKAINRFLLNLKENPVLNVNFKSMNIESVDKGQMEGTNLTNFVIVCRSK